MLLQIVVEGLRQFVDPAEQFLAIARVDQQTGVIAHLHPWQPRTFTKPGDGYRRRADRLVIEFSLARVETEMLGAHVHRPGRRLRIEIRLDRIRIGQRHIEAENHVIAHLPQRQQARRSIVLPRTTTQLLIDRIVLHIKDFQRGAGPGVVPLLQNLAGLRILVDRIFARQHAPAAVLQLLHARHIHALEAEQQFRALVRNGRKHLPRPPGHHVLAIQAAAHLQVGAQIVVGFGQIERIGDHRHHERRQQQGAQGHTQHETDLQEWARAPTRCPMHHEHNHLHETARRHRTRFAARPAARRSPALADGAGPQQELQRGERRGPRRTRREANLIWIRSSLRSRRSSAFFAFNV